MRTADSLARLRYREWEELEFLVLRSRPNRAEVERLGVLYRRLTSDLAAARRDFPDDRLTEYLESLAARVHPLVFRGRPALLADIGRFMLRDFPLAVQAVKAEALLATAAFFGSMLVAFALGLLAPDEFRSYVPAAMLSRIESVGQQYQEDGESPWVTITHFARPLTSWQIATNNIQVTLLAFAGGGLLGLFTLQVLVSNGLSLGLTTAFCVHEHAIVPLGTFVAAHGPMELSVICLAGAAGFAIGRAVLLPGDMPRSQAVVAAGRNAVTIAIGGAIVLLLSGLIEGLVSPSEIPALGKILVGVATGAALWLFLLRRVRVSAAGTRA